MMVLASFLSPGGFQLLEHDLRGLDANVTGHVCARSCKALPHVAGRRIIRDDGHLCYIPPAESAAKRCR